jgi:hypothetical protein
MKGKNVILIILGTSTIAVSLKAAFDLGAKIGIATLLSDLSSEDLSEIMPEEKSGWYKDISSIHKCIKGGK